MNLSKSLASSALALGLLANTAAHSQSAAPAPDFTLAYNIGGTTDYRFRGISQSSFKPAVQGGIDFSHKSGAYAGVWASNVNWIKDYIGATDGSLEVDFFGGYKGELAKDLGFDLGVIAYVYPSNNAAHQRQHQRDLCRADLRPGHRQIQPQPGQLCRQSK